MIQPSDRGTLTEALQPPPGYRFDAGVATTYSLSLGALLGLPAHIALLAGGDSAAEEDPLRVVEGLRRASRKLAVFCERGRMEAPPRGNPLAVMAEGMVHEVCAPHGGAFHPKLWVLRFVADAAGAAPATRIRLLVLTRNLTWDRCWDLRLCLEGVPSKATPKDNQNKALADLLRWLPANVVGAAPDAGRSEMIRSLARDIDRADWELPDKFTKLAFHVLGMGKRPQPWLPFADDGKTSEALIMSPFLGSAALEQASSRCEIPLQVISRADALDGLRAEVFKGLGSTHVLKPETALSEGEEHGANDSLHGLHAKMAVFKRGQRVHVSVGSANYTNAVVQHGINVEVVAELSGPVKHIPAPSQWLGKDYLEPLLDAYEPGPGEDAEAAERRMFEDKLEELRRTVAAAKWTLVCEQAETSGCRLALACPGFVLGAGTLRAWPLAVLAERARPVLEGQAELGSFAVHEVSTLMGFELTLDDERAKALGILPICFALEVQLLGAPKERDDALMAHLLGNRAAFLRYLGLLLDDPKVAGGGTGAASAGWRGQGALGLSTDYPLFEQLLRIYARDPDRLQTIGRMVRRLQSKQAEGESCLPEDFMALWKVVGDALAKEAE